MNFLSLKWLLVALLAFFGLPYLAGCSSMMPDKGFDTVRSMASQAREGLETGSAQWSASFEGVNPGVTVEAGVKYFATAYYAGVAGQFSANAAGQLTGLDAEAKAHVRDIEKSTTLNTTEKNQLIADVLRSALKIPPATATTPPVVAPPAGTPIVGAFDVLITDVDADRNRGFARATDGTLIQVNNGGGLLGKTVKLVAVRTEPGLIVADVVP